jgi:glycosyltransferase involved in cell wall biosynthesis
MTAPAPDRPLKIFYWAASMEDGTYIYRMQMPGDELRRLGHDVRVSTRFDAWGREEADIVIGQRICQTGPSWLWCKVAEERRAAGRGGMIYEVDDDLFNVDRSNPLGVFFQLPKVQEYMRDALRASDAVTVSTAPLADVIAKVLGPRAATVPVHVLPNAVRAETLGIRRQRPPARATMYGWQGSHTHAQDWEVARAAVERVLTEDIGRVRLRFVGNPQRLDIPGGPKVDFQGWTTDIAEHYQRVAEFDVTLAPLALMKFNNSKSGLRVQESLALGVPVIASDVPSYRGWVEHGVTGLLVRPSTAAWVDAMRAMQDPGRRAEMAEAGRAAAKAWTIDATIGRWLDVYRSLLPEGS